MKRICRTYRRVPFLHILLVLALVIIAQDVYLRLNKRDNRAYTTQNNDHAIPQETYTRMDDDRNRVELYNFHSTAMGRDLHTSEIDCSRVIVGDQKEIAKARTFTVAKMPKPRDELTIYMELKAGCYQYKQNRGFILDYLSKEERDFPIAMNVMLYKEFHQVEDLMRAIYRPQNYYCLHVDKTSPGLVHAVARAFADCFGNVIVPRDVIDVVYGQLNLMTPEIICMYELLKYASWKYFINLTGQEYPIKTNRQMVKIFKAFNGANDVVTSPRKTQSEAFRKRWNKHGDPPHRLRLVKGSSHIVVSRDFAEFLTSDKRVRDLVSFLYDTIFPEESFWTSVNNERTLQAPGGFQGTLDEAINKTWNGRVKWWMGNPGINCTGFFKHAICIFGVGDLSRVVRDTPILANKFYWDSQPMALRCIQEWLYNRTRDEYFGVYNFDASHYATLPNVRQVYRRQLKFYL